MSGALAYKFSGGNELQHNTMKLMQAFLSTARTDEESFSGIGEVDIPILEELGWQKYWSLLHFLKNNLKFFRNLFIATRIDTQRQLCCWDMWNLSVDQRISINSKQKIWCYPVHRFPEILISLRKVSRQGPGKTKKDPGNFPVFARYANTE